MFLDHARRSGGKDWLDADGWRSARQAGEHVLFARKFRPDYAPDVLRAIESGGYY